MTPEQEAQLKRLFQLKEEGILTEREFQQKRDSVLRSKQAAQKPSWSFWNNLHWVILGGFLLVILYFYITADHSPEPVTRESVANGLASHAEYAIEERIKSGMNDPNSFESVNNSFVDKGDRILVYTKFRGKNGFGGVITNTYVTVIDGNDGHIVLDPQPAP